MPNTPDDIFKSIVTAAHAVLKPLGYSKSGLIFRRIGPETTLMLGFQRDKYNTAENIEFTINLGVIINSIFAPVGRSIDLKKASTSDTHVYARIAWPMNVHGGDKWWEITPQTDATPLADEILAVIRDFGLPYLDQYSTTAAIVAVWRAGECLGHSEGLRQRYLAQIDGSRTLDPDPIMNDKDTMIAAWRSGNLLGFPEHIVKAYLADLDRKAARAAKKKEQS